MFGSGGDIFFEELKFLRIEIIGFVGWLKAMKTIIKAKIQRIKNASFPSDGFSLHKYTDSPTKLMAATNQSNVLSRTMLIKTIKAIPI